MSGFDQNRIYSVQVLAGEQHPDAPSEIERLFFEFLSGYRVGGEFVYRYVAELAPLCPCCGSISDIDGSPRLQQVQ